MQPLISIIIPTYNRFHLLGETLDSVLAQTYENWECIIIDDGSTDYTQELIEFYMGSNPRFLYFKRQKNRLKGANACRNYGFEISKGEFINWFDDDDLMHPEKLEKQIKTLENSKYNFSVCQALVFKNTFNTVIGLKNKWICSDHVFCDYLIMKIGWMTPSALWKKDFLKLNNFKFDEELQAAQEWEFHCRILNKFPEYAKIDDALILIRKHEKSVTYHEGEKQRFWYYFQARLKIYKNTDLDLDLASKQFLQDYLLNSFKKMIITRNSNTFKVYKLFVLPEKIISPIAKVNAFLAIVTFKLFNKGNFLLQKIKYN